MRIVLRSVLLVLGLMLGAGTVAHACIFTYTLVDGAGGRTTITPGRAVELTRGENYRIEITMREDHGNCLLAPEDTLFLLDEARWRVGRDTQPLILREAIEWIETGSRRYATAIAFTASQSGAFSVNVLRECTRGGYSATLLFQVPGDGRATGGSA